MKIIPVKLTKKLASVRCLVDDEDYDMLVKMKWYLTSGYAMRKEYSPIINGNRTKRNIQMHRLVMRAPDFRYQGVRVDHINGDKLDNRKINLRFCTPTENRMNSRLMRNNLLGVKGVSHNHGGYKATIISRGVWYHLGTFPTIKAASDAYETKAKELHGEFYRPSVDRANAEYDPSAHRTPSSCKGG